MNRRGEDARAGGCVRSWSSKDFVLSLEAFILAGGQSSRFGSDKALASVNGRSLLSHALRAPRGLGLDPWVVTPQTSAYSRYQARFLTKERPGRGPVEGVRVSLHECAAPWALILSVDMPGVTAASLSTLVAIAANKALQVDAARRGGQRPAAFAFCFLDRSGRRHPFPGLYNRRLLMWLDGPRPARSMMELLDRANALAIGPSDVSQRLDLHRVLRNVNRRGDL